MDLLSDYRKVLYYRRVHSTPKYTCRKMTWIYLEDGLVSIEDDLFNHEPPHSRNMHNCINTMTYPLHIALIFPLHRCCDFFETQDTDDGDGNDDDGEWGLMLVSIIVSTQ